MCWRRPFFLSLSHHPHLPSVAILSPLSLLLYICGRCQQRCLSLTYPRQARYIGAPTKTCNLFFIFPSFSYLRCTVYHPVYVAYIYAFYMLLGTVYNTTETTRRQAFLLTNIVHLICELIIHRSYYSQSDTMQVYNIHDWWMACASPTCVQRLHQPAVKKQKNVVWLSLSSNESTIS